MNIEDYREYCLSLGSDVEEKLPFTMFKSGENDPSFIPAGAKAFKHDLPNAEVHFVPSDHFALESHAAEIAAYIKAFLGETLKQ